MDDEHKPSLAMYGAGSCGGCEVSLLNVGERILTLRKVFDVVFFPFLEDFKTADLESLSDGAIDLCLVNGCMRTEHDLKMARLLRHKSKFLVAYGSCALEGCVPGLANLSSVGDMMSACYLDNPSTENGGGTLPAPMSAVAEGNLRLPPLTPTVRTVEDTVEVDFSVPGCPPEPSRIWVVLEEFISAFTGGGRLPARGTVMGAEEFALCEECPLERHDIEIDGFVRPHMIQPDPEHCLLEQGLVCLGLATRAGCGALCPQVGMGCRGCYGPTPGSYDHGARMVAALASTVGAGSVEENEQDLRASVEAAMETLVDPAGTLYRFSLANSLLKRMREERGGD
jgi:F420-non-reducing hydrogenase small subunit